MKRPEILAPVGNEEMLRAAIDAGADAIYFGIKGMNMRANSKNFTLSNLKRIVKICHSNNVKAYLTVNTIIYEDEIHRIKKILDKAKEAKVDGIICWDMAVIREAKKLGLEIHISTQASISNSEAANHFKRLGAKRFVLAREVTLKELKKIRKNTDLKIEIFAHGAMCVSVSGRCFLSEHLYGKSANRGECIQPCRREYLVKDPETKKELKLGNNYIMSPKDLCTLPFLEKLYAYADSLKIEGRGRSPEYVKKVVEAYKEALELIQKKKYDDKVKKRLMDKVKQVYNRDFSPGFYMGRPIEEFTDAYGSKSTKKKTYLGIVKNYYKKPKAAEIKIEAKELNKGDHILIIGPTTGVLEQEISSIQEHGKETSKAKKGSSAGIVTKKLVRKNDKVYVWK